MNRSRVLLLLMIIGMKVFIGFSSTNYTPTIAANSEVGHIEVSSTIKSKNLGNPRISVDTLYHTERTGYKQ